LIKQYLYNLGVYLSQSISVVLGGHPDNSISERVGRAYLSGRRGLISVMRYIIDGLALIILREKNHCVESVSGEPRAKEIWNWDKKDEKDKNTL
jgi:hypothetical protein